MFKLVIGIGNPGKEYAGTAHNAGLLFIEYLKDHFAPDARWSSARNFEYARISSGHDRVCFAKTKTFMNESGSAIRAAMKASAAALPELLLAHDDSDLELGTFRLSVGSGSAGHRGVESAIHALGSKEFARLRFGVRPAGPASAGGRKKAGDFVLKPLGRAEKKMLYSAFNGARETVIEKENLFSAI